MIPCGKKIRYITEHIIIKALDNSLVGPCDSEDLFSPLSFQKHRLLSMYMLKPNSR